MSQQLAYVIVTPYSLHKSRTGGILARLISRTGLELAGARLFAPSEELVRKYSEVIVSANDPQDRRIQGPTGVGSKGKYFGYDSRISFYSAARGLYNASFYAFYRYGTGTSYESGPLVAITRTELDLLKAEALVRLNRAAEAIPLINKRRVANGELPVIDINGPTNVAGCVPRRHTGECGSLWDALKYEKRIEGAGVDGQVAMWDARGWGTLAANSFVHFPIPGRELEIIRQPIYSFGGGGAGSAPAIDWARCPVALPRCP